MPSAHGNFPVTWSFHPSLSPYALYLCVPDRHCYDAGGNLLFRSKREKAADAANGGGEDAVEEARWNEVRAINLSHLHLTSLACMDKVPMVTSANFAANEVMA